MDGEPIEVRWATQPSDLAGAIALREEVFCVEQGVPREEELDGLDEDARHIVARAKAGGPVIGTTRLRVLAGEAKVGRVAVERGWRRRGVASRMLALALDGARESGCSSARLAAQVRATALYEQAGFVVESSRSSRPGSSTCGWGGGWTGGSGGRGRRAARLGRAARYPLSMLTQADRAAEQRRVKLAEIKRQVKDGSLTIRKMTRAERKRFPPRPASGDRK